MLEELAEEHRWQNVAHLSASAHNDGFEDDEGITSTTPIVNSARDSIHSCTVPLCVLSDLQLRFLCPDDLDEVRTLCQDWFPIGTLIS